MDRKLARAELIDRLLAELQSEASEGTDLRLRAGFCASHSQTVDKIFVQIVTTLGAQLADSASRHARKSTPVRSKSEH